jgi:hypothetical protein
MKKLNQDSLSPGRDLNPGPSEYKTGVPMIQQRCNASVFYTVLPNTDGPCPMSHAEILRLGIPHSGTSMGRIAFRSSYEVAVIVTRFQRKL